MTACLPSCLPTSCLPTCLPPACLPACLLAVASADLAHVAAVSPSGGRFAQSLSSPAAPATVAWWVLLSEPADQPSKNHAPLAEGLPRTPTPFRLTSPVPLTVDRDGGVRSRAPSPLWSTPPYSFSWSRWRLPVLPCVSLCSRNLLELILPILPSLRPCSPRAPPRSRTRRPTRMASTVAAQGAVPERHRIGPGGSLLKRPRTNTLPACPACCQPADPLLRHVSHDSLPLPLRLRSSASAAPLGALC